MSTATNDPPVAPQKTLRRRLLRLTERGFAAFGLLVVFYLLMFDLSTVISPSMAPTLKGTSFDNGDQVVTEKVTKWFRQPRRWEIITYRNKEGTRVMKRVAGLPGESVQLSKNGRLLIDGKPVETPPSLDRKYLRFGNLFDGNAVQCGEGYYVLGDDTKDSDDSRFNGTVSPNRVIGRAWIIVRPFARAGFVN